MALNRFTMASTVVLNAPVERIWALITDAKLWPEWCGVCAQVDSIPTTWSPGNKLAFKLRMATVAVPFRVTITDVSPERHVEWESTKLTITATRRISLQPTPDGIQITDEKVFSSWLLPIRLVYPRLLIRRMTESWLGDLKREVEGNASA
jgi:hypothetical protein